MVNLQHALILKIKKMNFVHLGHLKVKKLFMTKTIKK